MSFRARLTVSVAAAVAAAILLLAAATFVIVRGEMRGAVDRSLREIAGRAAQAPAPQLPADVLAGRRQLPPPRFGDAPGYLQLLMADGSKERPARGATPLPINAGARDVAAGRRSQAVTDATVDGVHLRVLTRRGRGDVRAIQVARPLTEVDRVLRRLGWLLALVTGVGVALAAGAGLAVARSATAPVRRLTRAAEHVAETQDLSERIDHDRNDELGRLASSFNRMLEALAAARGAQRQLVADASHELRTPLTSMRANLEVLESGGRLSNAERRLMLRDLVTQAEELSVLVGDLVELARGPEALAARDVVRLDQVVHSAVRRVQARAPGMSLLADRTDPTEVVGDRNAIERAVVNLLDNAVKWSPPTGEVEVSVRGGRIAVRDHGPGIADADLGQVFDRFYRADDARSLPGSGLGLAIVRQVAQAHGGNAFAQHADGGGALLVVTFPVVASDHPHETRSGDGVDLPLVRSV